VFTGTRPSLPHELPHCRERFFRLVYECQVPAEDCGHRCGGADTIGEFSYVLIQVARSAGLVENEVYNAVLAASLITILLNAFAVRFVPRWVDPGFSAGSN
jgi:hypothetical protein